MQNPLPQKTLILCIIISIFSLHYTVYPTKSESPVEKYYLERINDFEQKLLQLSKAISGQSPRSTLQNLFRETRLAYKKMAIITEYYNIYDSKKMNGPALKWVVEDDPKMVYDPHGLQVIEEKIFTPGSSLPYQEIQDEISLMLGITQTLSREKDLGFKFSDKLMFNAMQLFLIRLISLDITGFDSPIAQHSVPEAKSSLEGFQALISLYDQKIRPKAGKELDSLLSLLNSGRLFLNQPVSYNNFNRVRFIREYFTPLYSLFTTIRIKCDLLNIEEKMTINPYAASIFDTAFFNINAFSPTMRYWPVKERVELGKKLFYDNILSGTKTRSCASCHKPELAFTDGVKTALSVDGKTYLARNTPTLLYSALQRKQFYDSRTSVLENQLNSVVHNEAEMGGQLSESVTDLKADKSYVALFEKAYPADYEKISQYTIANAVSSYIRTLNPFNSRFDLYMRGDEAQMTAAEKRGLNLFLGKGKCATCHFVPVFNGLVPPAFAESESEVLGVPKNPDKKNAVLDEDIGRIGFTKASIHLYAFKTPTLRNIALTAPYMHNGVYNTLEEVIDFYNNGGGHGLGIAPPQQTLPADKLSLTKKEKRDLIAFMKALTDSNIAN